MPPKSMIRPRITTGPCPDTTMAKGKRDCHSRPPHTWPQCSLSLEVHTDRLSCTPEGSREAVDDGTNEHSHSQQIFFCWKGTLHSCGAPRARQHSSPQELRSHFKRFRFVDLCLKICISSLRRYLPYFNVLRKNEASITLVNASAN